MNEKDGTGTSLQPLTLSNQSECLVVEPCGVHFTLPCKQYMHGSQVTSADSMLSLATEQPIAMLQKYAGLI